MRYADQTWSRYTDKEMSRRKYCRANPVPVHESVTGEDNEIWGVVCLCSHR